MNEARQAFWEELNERITRRPNTPLRETERADSENDSWRPQRHLTETVGYSFNCKLRPPEIQVYMVARRNRDRDAVFDQLRDHQEQIDGKFDEELEWQPEDGSYKIILRRDADIENRRDEWDEYQAWLIDRAERLYFATGPVVAGFDAKEGRVL